MLLAKGGNGGGNSGGGGNGGGNSGGNGGGSSGSNGESNGNGLGPDQGKDTPGNGKSSDIENGNKDKWAEKESELKGKGYRGKGKYENKGKHKGWYKNGKLGELEYNPELTETTYYVSDVADPLTQVLMTYDEEDRYRAAYAYGLERIEVQAVDDTRPESQDPLYYLHDGLGSVRQLVRPNGAIRDHYGYDEFGVPAPGNKLSEDGRNVNHNAFGYTGELWDEEDDLQYLRSRYYQPEMGRFTTRDSFSGYTTNPLSMNKYAYVENNPVNYLDPFGFNKKDGGTKVVNGQPNPKGGPITPNQGTVKTSNGSAAYVFYLPEWENEAKDDRKRLAAYYGLEEDQIVLTAVTSADELTNAWNDMGTVDGKKVDIKAVVIDTHADASSLGFGNGNSFSANDISNLDKKNINRLMLYGCNAGHFDHEDVNPAAQFARKIGGGLVVASDGTVSNGEKRFFGLFGSLEYKSNNDAEFQRQLPAGSTRDNEGWIVYRYKDNNVSTSDSLGKTLTLTQMLVESGKAEW